MKTVGWNRVCRVRQREARVPNALSRNVDPSPDESHLESSKERRELRTLIRADSVPHTFAASLATHRLSLSSMARNYKKKGGHGGARSGAGNKPALAVR